MNDALPPDALRPPDLEALLQRLAVLEHNQRDMLFLLRTIRYACQHGRHELSPATRHIHRAVIRLPPFNGACPGCLDTRVVADDGRLIPPAEFDHFFGPAYSAPVHTWLICQPCHRALTNDRHLTWYRQLTARFRRYQAAVAAYTGAFGHRTPARLRGGGSRP